MIIGIDLDNTIINYDNAFYVVAKKNKFIKKILKKRNKENLKKIISLKSKNQWTKLQGLVYGKYIRYAKLNKFFISFLNFCKKNNFKVIIISQKTQYPIIGKEINLHNAAKKFLKKNLKLKFKFEKDIFFEKTTEDKIKRIKNCNCDYFIDDLTKILNNKKFPITTNKILFGQKKKGIKSFTNWREITSYFKANYRNLRKITGTNNQIKIFRKNNQVEKKYINPFNKHERYLKEVKFLEFFKKKRVSNIPEIIQKDGINLSIKYKFIKGIKYRRKKLKFNDIKKIFYFIKKINKYKTNDQFTFAKEFTSSSEEYFKRLKKKIKNIKNKYYFNRINIKFNQLCKKKYFKKLYKFSEKNKILSPCDFNVNNILIDKKKLKFIDFEYSGYDDIAKIFAVFFTQPDTNIDYYSIKKNLYKIIFLNDKQKIINNIEYLIPVCYLNWCLILYNQMNKSDDPKKKNYFKKKLNIYMKDNKTKFNIFKIFVF